MQLTQHRGDSLYVTRLGPAGSVATEYANAAPDLPVHRGIMRYADRELIALDYPTTTVLELGLDTAVADHQARLTAREDLLGHLGGTTPPAPIITKTSHHTHIAGFEAQAFEMTTNGLTTRVWYADDLPTAPAALQPLLAQLTTTSTVADPCSHGDGDDDDDHEGHDRHGHCHDIVTPANLVGKTLLRTETRTGTTWSIVLDTVDVRAITMTADELTVPPGFTPAPSADAAPSAPHSLVAPTAFATFLGGPLLSNIEVYPFYWGQSFADPAHADAVQELDNAIATLVSDAGFGALAQYGIRPGRVKPSHIIPVTPPAAVTNDALTFVETAGFVSSVMGSYGPMFWWKWGPDPLILVVANTTEIGSASGTFGGYHIDYITPSFLLPFPFDLMTNEFMPYAFVTLQTPALEVPAGALAARDTCPGQPWCGKISSFDAATVAISHELAEAATDPYPFFGWADLSKFPPWYKAELSDICEDDAYEKTRVGDYVGATIWSNVDADCIGPWRTTVHLTAPHGTFPASSTIQLAADVSAAIDRDHKLDNDTTWRIDGSWVGTGRMTSTAGLTPGPHHVEVTVIDANGLVTTDASDITIDPACAPDFGNGCGHCSGTVQCDGTCTIGTPGDWGQACGSCGGTIQCDSTCSIGTPVDFGQACGCGGTVQCDGTCSSYCSLGVDFSNIDDDAYLWLSVPGFDSDTASSIAQIDQGSVPRSGHFELGDWMRNQGLDAATFIVKIGNGGCFNSHGDISFVLNGSEALHAHKGDTGTFTHCGWTYRAVVTADVRAGSVTLADENFCINVGDCPF